MWCRVERVGEKRTCFSRARTTPVEMERNGRNLRNGVENHLRTNSEPEVIDQGRFVSANLSFFTQTPTGPVHNDNGTDILLRMWNR